MPIKTNSYINDLNFAFNCFLFIFIPFTSVTRVSDISVFIRQS